jgi:hypothetical protein
MGCSPWSFTDEESESNDLDDADEDYGKGLEARAGRKKVCEGGRIS